MLNKIQLIGRVGKDPELRYTADGTPVAQLNLATSESFKGKDGQKNETTTWHKLIFWRKLAEIVNQYVKKGALLYVDGKLVIREYEAKDGNKVKTHEIVVNDMKMLGGGKGEGGASGQHQAGYQGKPAGAGQSSQDPDFPTEEEDIPL
jgi:single-strand DNA-binding protein